MNGKIKKILNIAGILFAVFCIGCTFSLNCSAVGHKGSLELQCKFSEEDEEIILDGDEYIVTKIADFDKNQFSILPQYKNFDCNWNLIISSEYHEKAIQIADYIIPKEYFDYRGIVQKNGKLVFENIGTGLYLVARTYTKNTEYLVDPFLVSIPQVIESEVIYNVVVEPKFSKILDEESSKEEESSDFESAEPSRDISEPSEPFSTGDNTGNRRFLYMGIAVISCVTVIFFLGKKNKL